MVKVAATVFTVNVQYISMAHDVTHGIMKLYIPIR